jgi:plasmid stabilization system protein ParE
MHVVFSPEAAAEFADAERHYTAEASAVGAAFRDEVRSALARLRNWPLAAPIERDGIRRLLLSRFPYKMLYSVEPELLYIIAVAHQHRAPDYWLERKVNP